MDPINSTDYLNSCEEFARVMASMGRFMSTGHSYEEAYRYAVVNTSVPPVRQIWQEMLAIAEERRRSPLDALEGREALITPWLTKVFTAGAVAGVESIWTRGGEAFLDAVRTLRENPHLERSLRNRVIETLSKAGIELGLTGDFSSSAARRFVEAIR